MGLFARSEFDALLGQLPGVTLVDQWDARIAKVGGKVFCLLSDEEPLRLVEDRNRGLPGNEAARWLELTIEAVVENYSEYIDYNSTTTQSDRGEMLYTLLDFLRLRASYDRVAWNLRPVIIAHEVMVRRGRSGLVVAQAGRPGGGLDRGSRAGYDRQDDGPRARPPGAGHPDGSGAGHVVSPGWRQDEGLQTGSSRHRPFAPGRGWSARPRRRCAHDSHVARAAQAQADEARATGGARRGR